ncbi:MAG TPA: hypothetical protein VJ725_23055 [Thermoanaerobaculia bacterium]|nr:hypothetical protein [Thermoanaerobaculia bacterium]
MPELTESLHPAEDPAVAIPPIIDPDRFEDFPAFRETFLLYVTDPTANAALRAHGTLTYDLILDFWGKWPHHPEGFLRAALRAAIADLRCVEGFLLELEEGDHGSHHENFLAAVGAEIAVEVGELADRLDEELGSWRGEA